MKMRGLSARCDLALARAMDRIFNEMSNDYMASALSGAHAVGFSDYQRGIGVLPRIFVSEVELMKAWRHGWNFAGEMEEMAVCPGCRSGSGNPCHIHG
jgi:hypothetical protein